MATVSKTDPAAPTVFARKATGLVRESSLLNTSAFNILNVTIAYAILFPALFLWQFPGASLLLGGCYRRRCIYPAGNVLRVGRRRDASVR